MAVKYEKLVQEDFNVGTSRVWITAPAGGQARATQVGIHTPAVGQQKWTKTWNPGSIAAGSYATTDVTVTDAAVGALCMASHDKMLTNDLDISVHISAADTATVIIHNPTSAAVTVASGTVAVVVFNSKSASSPSDVGQIIVRLVDNEDSGFYFTFTAAWADPSFQIRDYATYSDEEDSGSLSPGNYDIVCTNPAGYWQYSSSADTGESGDYSITISLEAGETVTVTFTATYIAP